MSSIENISFIETLQIIDGHFTNPIPHIQRIRTTLAEIGTSNPILPTFSDTLIPEDKRKGNVKCRYLYNIHKGEIEFADYTPRQIHTLQLIEGNHVDYHLKYADRQVLNNLRAQRGICDDILIIKNGEITDTSYSNVVLFDGSRYIIPRAYLLNGTRRRQLLANGTATEARITPDDLHNFQCLYLINAMLDIKNNICVEVKNINKYAKLSPKVTP